MSAAIYDCVANLGEVASLANIEVKHDHAHFFVNVASINFHLGLYQLEWVVPSVPFVNGISLDHDLDLQMQIHLLGRVAHLTPLVNATFLNLSLET